MFKLHDAVREPRDAVHLVGVLRRLSLASLTPELGRSTNIDQAVAELAGHPEAEVRALSAQITGAWRAQVDTELQRRALARKPGPKPSGTGSSTCPACKGFHRAHTCRRA